MGKILETIKINGNHKAIIECTDLFTDIDEEIKRLEIKGISRNNIQINIVGLDSLAIDIDDYKKCGEALKNLMSDVKLTDNQEERFAKIISAITKNITYNYEKTGENHAGYTGNLVEGLLEGKCVCVGYSHIAKAAFDMYGIESRIVYNEDHSWNEVKLLGDWYNFDITNAPNHASFNKMGKCLRSDEQLKSRKIYEGKKDSIGCTKVPDKDLINDINKYIKENRKNVPQVFKKPNIKTRFQNKVREVLYKFGIKNKKMLPENSIIQMEDSEYDNSESSHTDSIKSDNNLEFTKLEPIVKFDHRKSIVWGIQSWDKSSVDNKVNTSFIELPDTANPNSLMMENKEEFLTIYNALIQEVGEQNSFIGKIDLIKNERGESSFIGFSTTSKECQEVIEQVQEKIENNSRLYKSNKIEDRKDDKTNDEKRAIHQDGNGDGRI